MNNSPGLLETSSHYANYMSIDHDYERTKRYITCLLKKYYKNVYYNYQRKPV